jgi:hypothetical protein
METKLNIKIVDHKSNLNKEISNLWVILENLK